MQATGQDTSDHLVLELTSDGTHDHVTAARPCGRQQPPLTQKMRSLRCVSCEEAGLDEKPRLSQTEQALEGLRFISKAISSNKDPEQLRKEVAARFDELADHATGLLNRAHFGACIGMKESKEFALELLDALTRRQPGMEKVQWVPKDNFLTYLDWISDTSFHARTQVFFDLCDKDSDGRIAQREIEEVILLSASSNKLSIKRDQAQEYASMIMEELDHENKGYIEVTQLKKLFREGLELDEGNQSTILPMVKKARYCSHIMYIGNMVEKSTFQVQVHWQRMWVFCFWVIVMVGLAIWKFMQYRNRSSFQVMGYCVCMAKGAAETLKLNMALILLPVCRNTITWLRSSFLGTMVPFDDNLNFHKLIAGAIAAGVILHAGMHLTCDFPRIAHADPFLFNETIAIDFNYRQPSYKDIILTMEVILGIIMVILMILAYLFANRVARKNAIKLTWPMHRLVGFNAFWYSHHLFLLVYIFFLIHSFELFLNHKWIEKTAWMYVSVPMALYVGERALRFIRASQYKVDLLDVIIYPGDVLALRMTRPSRFKYLSGMYMFLKCPNVSLFEWHPFTITSSPGDEYISVHVRAQGDWTKGLMQSFSQNFTLKDLSLRYPRLLIDGPYGAPAQAYKKYNVLLLVGMGIGATPYISILKDILHECKAKESEQQSSDMLSRSTVVTLTSTRTHVYFYWVTREQASFQWFKEVMNEVAENDQKAVIEMHNHLTSVYEEGDARSALLAMVQTLHHARSGVDIVSGTKVRTHFARPDWKRVFARLSARHPSQTVGVFYCGHPQLTKELDSLSQKFTRKTKTNFVFHKENF